MHRGSRFVASVAAAVLVPAVLVLPVVTGPMVEIRPVTPVVTELALSGIDPVGLRASAAPVAADVADDAAHVDADEHVGASPTTPATPTSAPDTTTPTVAALAPAVVTAETSTPSFTLVGVDWSGPTPPGTTVQVRVRENGVWTAWSDLPVDNGHGPDPGSEEAASVVARSGSEPLLTAPGSDGVQVRIDTPGGVVPTDAKVTLVDPQNVDADATVTPTPVSSAVAAGDPLRPSIITRAQWGADESLRSRGPIYTGSVKVGFLHHTASTSNYTPAQSTAQVRALYAYFTKGLNYSDIAYNFLVDRYGRLYEGRAGGMDKNVLGGHTAGFNQNTFAVSALGNFDTYKPTTSESDAIANSVSKLMAWKLALNHRDPMGSATLVSNSGAGTSRYGVGDKAVTAVISGHRDIGSTACPGRYLETLVPRIRALTKTLMGTQALNPSVTPAVTSYGGTGTTLSATTTAPVTWKLEVFSVCQDAPVRVLTGTQKTAGALKVAWNQKRTDGSAALPGTYRLVLSARNGSQVAYPVDTRMVVAETPDSPLGPCAQVARIGETERYSASVRAGRLAAPTSRTIVLAPGADAGLPEALIAAPLAAAKSAPRLLTSVTSLPASVETDITSRRVTTAYVVGTSTQISTAVDTRLRSLGVTTVVRLSGASHDAIAAAVADAMGVRGKAVAVSFDAGASLDLATSASAAAAVTRRPLLVVSRSAVPAATSAVIARLGITAVTLAGSVATVPDAVLRGLPGAVRVTGANDVVASAALAAALAPSATRVSVMPVGAVASRAVAAGTGRLLVLGSADATTVGPWLSARRAVTAALVVAPTTLWPDTTLGRFVAAMTARSTTSPPPTPAPKPTPTPSPSPTTPTPVPPTTIPSSFSFTGSGFGHGVGMSQYGARGMALEGYTGTQIVQHYYTGATVTPVRDDMDIRVNLLHQRSTVVLRSEPLASGGGGIEVTVAGKAPVLGRPGDVFVATSTTDRITVTRKSGSTTTSLGTGSSVSVRWSGTRTPGRAGSAATVVNVATSVSGLATSGHRYRYGTIDLATTSASRRTMEVVNQLRIHDEYLLGIAEVSSSWPAASLQAQVLAARSFALSRYGTGSQRAACRCHVDDGGGPYYDQTYVGWGKEAESAGKYWRAAVASTWTSATTSRAIVSKGKPITAFYFSASGGSTQASEDVWVSALSYTRRVDDHWSMAASVPWSSWTPRVRTQAQVAAAFGLKDVVRIDLSSRTAAGGVKSATAWSSTGASASIRGESLRSRLTLPSTWVWRAATVATGDATTAAITAARASTSRTVVLAPVDSPATVALASNLAAQKGWPLLLTTRTKLTTATRSELMRRRTTTVYAVGTSAQMPAALVSAVDSVTGTVVRVTGTTDPDVSVKIAILLARPVGTPAIVAAANDPVSVSIAGAAAAAAKRPLLLVPGGTVGSAGIAAYLVTRRPSSTWVIGSTTSVSDAVLATMRAGARVTGRDAVETSARVVSLLGRATSTRVVLTTSTGVVGALAVAPGAPLLVVATTLSPTSAAVLQKGVTSLAAAPGVPSAVVLAARRA